MDNPAYVIVDEIGSVVTEVKTELALPTLNFQHGRIKEFNTVMQKWGESPDTSGMKLPCVYLFHPFTVTSGKKKGIYGTIDNLRLFFMTGEPNINKLAKDRILDNYKPILYPIIRMFLIKLDQSVAFATGGVDRIEKSITDLYYWGEEQMRFLNDAVDCIEMNLPQLDVHNNPNCQVTGGFI